MDVVCVASISVWFRSKERPRNGIFSFDRARMKREPRNEKGGRGLGGGEEGRKLSSPPSH